MKKIAVLRCYKVSKKCSGKSCVKAFKNKNASFKDCEDNSQMSITIPCSGCTIDSTNEILASTVELKTQGVERIHLSTCIMLKCPYYNEFLKELSKDFQVVGYTHALKNNKKAIL